MIPPSLLVLKIGQRGRHISIPVFLLWPGALLLAPAVLIFGAVCAARTGRIRYMTAAPKFYSLVCALRGLDVDVNDRDDSVFISIR